MNIDVETADIFLELLRALDDIRDRFDWFGLDGEIWWRSPDYEKGDEPIYKVFYSPNQGSHMIRDIDS